MRIEELLEKKETASKKITRDAFLYLEPKGDVDEFAQCATCSMFLPKKQRCGILGPHKSVVEEASCGMYLHGEPNDDQESVAIYTAKEVGYVRRQVRCENCVSFDSGTCNLYKMLNEAHADMFDLDEKVKEKACCNAQEPKSLP